MGLSIPTFWLCFARQFFVECWSPCHRLRPCTDCRVLCRSRPDGTRRGCEYQMPLMLWWDSFVAWHTRPIKTPLTYVRDGFMLYDQAAPARSRHFFFFSVAGCFIRPSRARSLTPFFFPPIALVTYLVFCSIRPT